MVIRAGDVWHVVTRRNLWCCRSLTKLGKFGRKSHKGISRETWKKWLRWSEHFYQQHSACYNSSIRYILQIQYSKKHMKKCYLNRIVAFRMVLDNIPLSLSVIVLLLLGPSQVSWIFGVTQVDTNDTRKWRPDSPYVILASILRPTCCGHQLCRPMSIFCQSRYMSASIPLSIAGWNSWLTCMPLLYRLGFKNHREIRTTH